MINCCIVHSKMKILISPSFSIGEPTIDKSHSWIAYDVFHVVYEIAFACHMVCNTISKYHGQFSSSPLRCVLRKNLCYLHKDFSFNLMIFLHYIHNLLQLSFITFCKFLQAVIGWMAIGSIIITFSKLLMRCLVIIWILFFEMFVI